MAGSTRLLVLAILLLAACSGAPAPSATPNASATAGQTPTPVVTPPASTATPASSPGVVATYAELLALIPPTIAGTCREDPDNARLERAAAMAFCEPDEVIVDDEVTVEWVMYFAFATDDVRRLDLWTEYWGHLGEPADGACADGPATSLYEVDGTPVGRLVCGEWPNSDDLAAFWYDDRPEILMALRLDSGDYADLAGLVEAVTIQP
jgi:hypothetical protein